MKNPKLNVIGALTSVNSVAGRVSMHGVREEILDAQIQSIGLSSLKVALPYPCTNEFYEAEMAKALNAMERDEVHKMVFGDLFLEDIRAYREEKLEVTNIQAEFPLWGQDTKILCKKMLTEGLEAFVVTVDPQKIEKIFCGRPYDESFLNDLPEEVDPCGENGEFHTVVVNAPCFSHKINLRKGETIERDGFYYTDFELEA